MDNTEIKQVYTIQSQRLDRIEEKLDQMAQAIIALARAEEKISTLAEFNKQQSEQIQSLINRIFWLIAGGLVAAITWELIVHLNN